MQSLPTAITTAQLNALVNTMKKLPGAQVMRHPDIVTVQATKKATGERVTVFRAATADGAHWHAMAVPGLIARV